jgi:ADP-heptose:LPS heptosyltransferase
LINKCNVWIAVDNFFQHLAFMGGKRGIVIFSQSDPEIFGHKENVNLLKGRQYLRERQFDIWETSEYKEEVFVTSIDVINAVNQIVV